VPISVTDPVDGSIISASTWGHAVFTDLTSYWNFVAGLIQSQAAASSANIALTTSPQDITGATVTVNVVGAHAFALVTINAQVNVTVASASHYARVSLYVDSVVQDSLGSIKDSTEAVHDNTHSFTWRIPLAAGSHTLKASALKDNAAPTVSVSNTFGTNIVVMLFDLT
jgi:hypothetical protein